MSLPFDQIACCDYESFYSDDFGFGKLAMTEYVRGDQWETQTCAMKVVGAKGRPVVWVGHDEIYRGLRTIDWSRTAFMAHNTNFDGLISTHHFGVYPCFWIDTLAMARFVLGVDKPLGLDQLSQRLGRGGKENKAALTNVKGRRLADFSPEELEHMKRYNGDDVEETIFFYETFKTNVPENEMKLIDITTRMYAEPVMLLDGDRLQRLYESELERKKGILERLAEPLAYTLEKQLADQEAKYRAYEAKGKTYAKPRLTRNQILMKEMGSAEKFSLHLQAAGIEPPVKVSGRTGQPAFAFAKNDLDFKVLLDHPTEHVRDLVEARLMSKSSIVETRSETLLKRVDYPTPIFLNYCAARTQRWGGGDGVNWQNPPRRGPGAEIRKALVAPQGTKMIIADASQIEARMNAWLNGQEDKLDVFRLYDAKLGPDVYCFAATSIYGRYIDAELNPEERFVGKVFELAAGYGAGAAKINYMFRCGQFGPPMVQDLEDTKVNLKKWRKTNNKIEAGWGALDRSAKLAFLGDREIEYGPLIFELGKRGGYIHGPHGGYMFYPNIEQNDEGGVTYIGRNGPVRMWGGIWDVHACQFLSRVLLGEQMVQIAEEFPESRIVMSTHDEVGIIIEIAKAERMAHRVKEIMSTPSWWCEEIPLNADVKVADFYNKS
jgi:DNA polymerase